MFIDKHLKKSMSLIFREKMKLNFIRSVSDPVILDGKLLMRFSRESDPDLCFSALSVPDPINLDSDPQPCAEAFYSCIKR